jgi:ribose-phosphate pyrophosphokinase
MAAELRTDQPWVVLAGSGNAALAAALAEQLGVVLAPYRTERFPDGEMLSDVGYRVRGGHALLVQPTAEPNAERLLELLLMADACHRAGARAVTAIIPYLGYARQEHRTGPNQSLGMRVVAELLDRGRFDRIVMVDLHADAIEGFLSAPVEHVSAVTALAAAARSHAGGDSVVVSPDLGAVKRAREVARILDLPMAVVHKTRLSPSEVSAERVIGDVRGLRPIVVDDMITTAGTLEAAAAVLLANGAAREIIAVVTHALLVGPAVERLARIGLRRLIASDSVPPPQGLPFALETVDLAPVLAATVRRACAR